MNLKKVFQVQYFLSTYTTAKVAVKRYLSVIKYNSFCFRYEIFIDEVKPNDLSAAFLKEFMDLPTSYFAAGAPLKYCKSLNGRYFVIIWSCCYTCEHKLNLCS